jgi:hypothetical protein
MGRTQPTEAEEKGEAMRDKLIELLGDDVCKHSSCGDCEYNGSTDMCIAALKAYMADHLIAHGVTIVDNCIGSVVWGIWEVTEYRRNGRKKNMKVQITTARHLKRALESGAVDIRKKVCTKSDLTRMGKIIFRTREEAELAIREANEAKREDRP